MSRRRPIQRCAPSCSRWRRCCDFARDRLALDPKRRYSSYAHIDRKYVVWNVFATPEFSTYRSGGAIRSSVARRIGGTSASVARALRAAAETAAARYGRWRCRCVLDARLVRRSDVVHVRQLAGRGPRGSASFTNSRTVKVFHFGRHFVQRGICELRRTTRRRWNGCAQRTTTRRSTRDAAVGQVRSLRDLPARVA